GVVPRKQRCLVAPGVPDDLAKARRAKIAPRIDCARQASINDKYTNESEHEGSKKLHLRGSSSVWHRGGASPPRIRCISFWRCATGRARRAGPAAAPIES